MKRDLLHLIDNHKVIDLMWYDDKNPLPAAYVALFVPKSVHTLPNHIGLSIFEVAPKEDFKHPHFVAPPGEFLAAQKILLDHFYPIDWSKKKIIGITGTNGKTTTCELGRQICEQLQISAFSLGSLGLNIKGMVHPIHHHLTTPPYIELHKLLHLAYKTCEIGFIEVSAHGIHQNRCFEIPFSAGGWTSFSQDHLDYFANMDDYFQTKMAFVKRITQSSNPKPFIVSSKQIELQQALSPYPITITDGSLFKLNKKRPPFLHIPYNLENLDVAIGCLEAVINEKIAHHVHFDQLEPAAGRFNVLEKEKDIIIIDSAHTPDALENVLKAAKIVYPNKQLHVLFGCGGDRDSKKRPLMGRIAQDLANRVYVTSDNPRHEDPEVIMDQITSGMNTTPYFHHVDRKKTILKALDELQHTHHNSILVIAGKGPEEYQIIKDQKIPFNDAQIVQEYYSAASPR